MVMRPEDFGFDLPEELIAQHPARERRASRLLCVDRASGRIAHSMFASIADRFSSGDILVINDTRVLPARLFALKESTQVTIEVMLIEKCDEAPPKRDGFSCAERWLALVKPARRLKPGMTLALKTHDGAIDRSSVVAIAEENSARDGMKERVVDLYAQVPIREKIVEHGVMPLPPYIKRDATSDDTVRYQTVFARKEGAIAAPTAGLHFDDTLLAAVRAKGVTIVPVTLHVGYGTFQPVAAGNLEEHVMHTERLSITPETAQVVNNAKREKRRVIACGTTVVRALESAVDVQGFVQSGERATNIFIYPPYRFKIVDALITNFHLPQSSLMMLVSAFGGMDLMRRVYREAVAEKYRFFSYGDAMMIE